MYWSSIVSKGLDRAPSGVETQLSRGVHTSPTRTKIPQGYSFGSAQHEGLQENTEREEGKRETRRVGGLDTVIIPGRGG